MSGIKVIIVCCLFLGLIAPTAHSTTVVAKLESHRIVLAADTRGETKLPAGQSANPDYHDDYCKIAVLGNVGFATTGTADYHKSDLRDSIADWSALEDARTSSALHKNNLVEMAEDWGSRALTHYQSFYSINPSRVQSLTNSNNILILGLFAGWDKGLPILISVSIKIEPSVLPHVVSDKTVLPQRDLPYATNAYTDQLIEGDPKQTVAIAEKWNQASKKFPKSELDWRWFEFLIQATSDQDQTVGKDADVLEIMPSGSHWLHTSGCSAH